MMYNYIKKWKGDAKKMLLNFKMENFRSFKDETFFTMLSSKQKTHNDYVIDKSVNGNKLRVLPMTVIYGANACGKSNIVLAMDILKKMVMKGILNCKELESYKSMLSFIRDTSWYDPVSLEITFSTQNNIYRYGIKFTDIDVYKIEEEVLYVNDDLFFSRDDENQIYVDVKKLVKKGYINKDDADFSERLIHKLNQTLDKQKLVVAGAISNLFDKKYFEDFNLWFEKFNVIMNANDMNFRQKDLKTIFNKKPDKDIRRNIFESASVKEVMNIAEFGNQKIGFMAETDNDELSMCSMYQVPLRKDEQPQKKYAISMIVDSELMESRGTIHLIRLLQPFIDVLDNGGVIVLDEMDASLHFEIVVSLIRIFNNKDINKNNAQLIFNTHNPIYLDGELLRHDQIVMVEKRRNDMVSEIYSLADYKLRPEERILKNYLNGKYGALPHMDLEIAFKHILEREANNLESSKEQ